MQRRNTPTTSRRFFTVPSTSSSATPSSRATVVVTTTEMQEVSPKRPQRLYRRHRRTTTDVIMASSSFLPSYSSLSFSSRFLLLLLLLLAGPTLQVESATSPPPEIATPDSGLVLLAVSSSSSTSVSRGPSGAEQPLPPSAPTAPVIVVVPETATPSSSGSGSGATGSGTSATGTTGTGSGAGTGPSAPSSASAEDRMGETAGAATRDHDLDLDDDLQEENRTREALSSQSSEHNSVVFVADGAGYVPVTQLRSRVPAHFRPSAAPTLAEDPTPEWSAQSWDRAYYHYGYNKSRVQHIEAECQDDYMKIRVGFNGSFNGLLYSSGYSYDPECVYVNGTGRDYYEFYIQLNRCGTLGKNTHGDGLSRKQPSKNFMWNTVTVQYNPMIEEEWDEHFKVTCEYGYDFWKTVTFPFLDVEVATGNPVVFTLSPPECYMEVRHGYGITGTRVSGPVRVGDPLTLLIYMRSKYDGFDIVVNDCYAHNGANKRIQLIDQYGCPVDEKLISRFRGSWSETGIYETQVFAYMKTFRFTGSPALYVECDVRMCHGKCPNQPCHWRNSKSVSRRSVTLTSSTTLAPLPPVTLSENISLFQSLRVLQEGEPGDEDEAFRSHKLGDGLADPDSICVKNGAFTALFGFGCLLTTGLGLAVALLCCRVRALGKGAPLELTDTEVRTNRELLAGSTSALHNVDFLTHKGRIH